MGQGLVGMGLVERSKLGVVHMELGLRHMGVGLERKELERMGVELVRMGVGQHMDVVRVVSMGRWKLMEHIQSTSFGRISKNRKRIAINGRNERKLFSSEAAKFANLYLIIQ